MYILINKERTRLRQAYKDVDMTSIRSYSQYLLSRPMFYPIPFQAEIFLISTLTYAHAHAAYLSAPTTNPPLAKDTLDTILEFAYKARSHFQNMYFLNKWCVHSVVLYEESHELVRWLQAQAGDVWVERPLDLTGTGMGMGMGMGGGLDESGGNGFIAPVLQDRHKECWFEMLDQLGKCDCVPDTAGGGGAMAGGGSDGGADARTEYWEDL